MFTETVISIVTEVLLGDILRKKKKEKGGTHTQEKHFSQC